MAQAKQTPELSERILSLLAMLTDDKKVISMLEKVAENEGLLTNMPYICKIRAQWRKEGCEEGLVEGEKITVRQGVLSI